MAVPPPHWSHWLIHLNMFICSEDFRIKKSHIIVSKTGPQMMRPSRFSHFKYPSNFMLMQMMLYYPYKLGLHLLSPPSSGFDLRRGARVRPSVLTRRSGGRAIMAGSSYLSGGVAAPEPTLCWAGALIAHLGTPCPDVWFHLIVRPEA